MTCTISLCKKCDRMNVKLSESRFLCGCSFNKMVTRIDTHLNCPGDPLDKKAAVVVSLIFIVVW